MRGVLRKEMLAMKGKSRRRLVTSVLACFMAVILFAAPVLAASRSTVSLSYPKMNALKVLPQLSVLATSHISQFCL